MFGFGKKQNAVTEAQVLDALRTVIEPELRRDLVSLNMIKNLEIDGGDVSFTIELTTPACPLRSQMEREARDAVIALDGVEDVAIAFDSNVARDTRMQQNLDISVRNIVAIASGKGGVGKSTVAVNVAIALAQDGARVGLLDADIYGPNIPMMMGVDTIPPPRNQRIVPSDAYGVTVMSMGFIVPADQPVVWRGPMLHSAIGQLLNDVEWGELDYLIVDMPPGTGDVQLSLAQTTPLSGGVIVTTPQNVSLADARKGLATFEQLEVDVLGLIENMSYFVAPDTGKRYNIFGSGGGRRYAEEIGVPLLGQIPIDPRIVEGGDAGTPIVVSAPESEAATALKEVARRLAARLSVINLSRTPEGAIGISDIPIIDS